MSEEYFMDRLWFINDANLYSILCPHKLKNYKETHNFCHYKKGDYVYFEEDNANTIYLIEKGKVKLGYCNDQGDEVVKIILSKGEIFGEKVLLGEEKRNEFAQIIENETSLCPIPVDVMQHMLRDNTDFSLRIYKFIGFRFKKLERRLQILLFKDVKTRLMEFLKELTEDFGIKIITGDILIKHPYTQKEIAALIGTSRPTLNALLNELKIKKVIEFNQKEILIKSNNVSWLTSQ